jgi:hypothetical protein
MTARIARAASSRASRAYAYVYAMRSRGRGPDLAYALATLLYIGLATAARPAHAYHAPLVPPRCTEFAGLVLPPAAIGLPTRGAQVDDATVIPANAPGNVDGEYCRITGKIKSIKIGAPDIRFELNLPRRWNGRALQFGGGGYSGVVVSGTGTVPFSPDKPPLARGYATFGDDSGHVGNPGVAAFGLVDEAVINFGYAHLKKTHDVALTLIARGYGRLPDRMYFAGGSTGGREGYTAIQRFPDDYDGVIANSPALNFSGVRLLGIKVGQAEYHTIGGFIPPALLDRVYRRTIETCDMLDGAPDGIIGNVEACRALEPQLIRSMRCGPHADSDDETCLSPAQVKTLLVLRDGLTLPYTLAWQVNRYRGYNVFQGTRFTGMLGLAHTAERLPDPAFLPNGYLFAQGDAYIRYFVTRDNSVDSLQFDVQHPGAYLPRLVDLSGTIGAMNPDMSRFIARGGKLITLQGLADEVISPNQTIAYYRALVARYGAAQVDGFMRLYMVPGFQHGNGVFIPSIDMLGALDNWVTHGIAPQTLVATDLASATYGRSRPLCRFPGFPRYVGYGSLDRAENFRCVESMSDR